MTYLEQNGYFIFDNVCSSDFDVWINGGGTYNAPKRQYTTVKVPGRNGSLTIDNNAFDEIEHTYTAFIAKNFSENIENFRNELLSRPGHRILRDTYHPSEFYRARFMNGLEVDVAPAAAGGAFTLTFERDPRRFLVSGEFVNKLDSGSMLFNPTRFASKPLIHVTGYGTLTINGTAITISNSYPDIYIDSELMDCYSGTANANGAVTFANGEFPVLEPGENTITYSLTITELTITPRWWRI